MHAPQACPKRSLLPCTAAIALAFFASRGSSAQNPPPTSRPAPATVPATGQAITFNSNFEGGSIGRVEKTSATTFRVHVQGQHDERGRNRQASWYYFRMENVRGQELTITLTDLIGEYNDKPGTVPAGPEVLPVLSEDGGKTWRHFVAGSWDNEKKEMTLTFRPDADAILIAHVPPYTPADLDRLLTDVVRSPHAVVEVIGQTVQGRPLKLITVTDRDVPDDQKKSVWLQARQHAWEAGTSYVAEGALRFITSDDATAKELRRRTVFRFTPMVDVDGCVGGKVRFNANGYDVNRHWDKVDLRSPELLRQMPEIWYTKKAIAAAVAQVREKQGIDLLVNMHNTETAEYLETNMQEPAKLAAVQKLSELLTSKTTFDPSRDLTVRKEPVNSTNVLAREYGVPVLLMEQRISPSKKLGRRPTIEDRLAFGRELISVMAEAVR